MNNWVGPIVKHVWNDAWSTLVEGGKERYRPPGKLTLELVHANQNKLLCLWTMQLTKWAGKVPYLLLLKCSMNGPIPTSFSSFQSRWQYVNIKFVCDWIRTADISEATALPTVPQPQPIITPILCWPISSMVFVTLCRYDTSSSQWYNIG